MRFLAWNMPFHAEHHAWPSIPFHALPRTNALIRDRLRTTAPGYRECAGRNLADDAGGEGAIGTRSFAFYNVITGQSRRLEPAIQLWQPHVRRNSGSPGSTLRLAGGDVKERSAARGESA